ncbi:MAG: hypothetical protein M3440_07220 [Chloroflexota bacterium]|nr:hypothetical protein [Chloroflexota bacterium]
MMHDITAVGPTRHEVRVDKYHAPRTPADGPPDETQVVVIWQEGDGSPITDSQRIDDLEARLTQEGTD